MTYSRRDFVRMTSAIPATAALTKLAIPAFAQTRNKSYYKGVQLGVQTYCFHDIPVDGANHAKDVVDRMLQCDTYSCELYSPQIEPGGMIARAALVMQEWAGGRSTGTVREYPDPVKADKARKEQLAWRMTVPISWWQDIRKTFNNAGIDIYAHCYTFYPESTDAEIDRGFQFAKALGAKLIDSSLSISILKRVVPYAEKHKMPVAVHGHAGLADPDQISNKESFEKAFSLSKWVWANLDIGHYWAAGGDPVEFIKEHHDRISNLHIKDRLKNDGPAVSFGEGDTPIKEVLLLLQKEKYPIPAFIEYEYPGKGTPEEETRKCLDYCKKILDAGA